MRLQGMLLLALHCACFLSIVSIGGNIFLGYSACLSGMIIFSFIYGCFRVAKCGHYHPLAVRMAMSVWYYFVPLTASLTAVFKTWSLSQVAVMVGATASVFRPSGGTSHCFWLNR